MEQFTSIIIGAGPSGIGVACGLKELEKSKKSLILEKNYRVGGLAGSFKLDNDIIDFGPHRLAPTIQSVTEIAKEACGEDLLVKKSEHGVYINKKLYQFPPKLTQWFDIKSQLLLIKIFFSFIKSLILNIFISRNLNFKKLIISKFGKYFYTNIVKPMADKVWGNSDNLDPQFVNKRFSQLNPSEFLIKKIFNRQDLNPDNFYYPKNGFQQLWDDIIKKNLKNYIDVKLETYPKEIIINDKNLVSSIKLNNGIIQNLDKTQIISTIPVIELIKCLKNIDKSNLEEKLKEVKIRSMMLVIVKLDQIRTSPYRTLIFPQSNVIFNRIFEQNLYSRDTVEENKSVIVADVTFDLDTSEEKINEFFEKTKSDIINMDFIDKNKIISIKKKIIKYAYVSPTKTTKETFNYINKELNKIKNLNVLGRFGAGDYDNSDYAIESGINLANYLFNKNNNINYSDLLKSRENNIIVG